MTPPASSPIDSVIGLMEEMGIQEAAHAAVVAGRLHEVFPCLYETRTYLTNRRSFGLRNLRVCGPKTRRWRRDERGRGRSAVPDVPSRLLRGWLSPGVRTRAAAQGPVAREARPERSEAQQRERRHEQLGRLQPVAFPEITELEPSVTFATREDHSLLTMPRPRTRNGGILLWPSIRPRCTGRDSIRQSRRCVTRLSFRSRGARPPEF